MFCIYNEWGQLTKVPQFDYILGLCLYIQVHINAYRGLFLIIFCISFPTVAPHNFCILSRNYYWLSWNYVAFIMSKVDQLRFLPLAINNRVFNLARKNTDYNLFLTMISNSFHTIAPHNFYIMLSNNYYWLSWNYVVFNMSEVNQLWYLDLTVNYRVF